MIRCIILFSLCYGVFSQNETLGENVALNLDPVLDHNDYSTGDSATDWVNQILAQSLHNNNTKDAIIQSPEVPNNECTTRDNITGVCVLYYQCDSNHNTLIEDGTTIIDLRIKTSCLHYLEVCCGPDNILSNETNEKDNSRIILEPDVKENTNEVNLQTCGWNNPALYVFQTKRKDVVEEPFYANYGEFPWMIALMRKINDTEVWSSRSYIGGGSLIHPSVVLTAAHLVKDKIIQLIKCRAGEWDTQVTFEIFPYQERDVKKIVTHPEYYRPSLYYDLGLLFLESPFEMFLSPNIGIACIGNTLPPPGTECYGMGWGKKIDKKYAVILKKMRLPLVGDQECQSVLRKNRLGPFFTLHESLICAGGEERLDVCKGDGGSPLVCPIQVDDKSVRYAVFGMAAYGLGCYSKNVPGVFVNVPHARSWLDTTLSDEGYSNNTYTY